MPVVVPSAPEVQETTRMLEDSESVSSWGPQLSQDVKGAACVHAISRLNFCVH